MAIVVCAWLVGLGGGNDVCHHIVGGVHVLDFHPIHTKTHIHTFRPGDIPIRWIIRAINKNSGSFYYYYYFSSTQAKCLLLLYISWGVYCLFMAENIKRHSNKIDILIIWPVVDVVPRECLPAQVPHIGRYTYAHLFTVSHALSRFLVCVLVNWTHRSNIISWYGVKLFLYWTETASCLRCCRCSYRKQTASIQQM